MYSKILSQTFLIFALLLNLPITQAFAEAMTLDAYLSQVMESNPTVLASKLNALALKHKINPQSSLDDPFVAIGFDDVPLNSGGGGLRRYQISQTLPFPGKLKARAELASSRFNAATADSETMARQMKVMGIQTYLRASFNRSAIALNERIQKDVEDAGASAKARYRAGGPAHHEWLLAKIELSVLKVEHMKLVRTQETLKVWLNELRDHPPEAPIEVMGLNQEAQDAGMPELDLSAHPEVLSWKELGEAARKELKLVKLSYAPDFVIQGMAMEPRMREPGMPSTHWGVMVGVTVPLFFWRKQSELVAAAEKDRQVAMAQIRALENRLNTELADARQQYKTSVDVLQLYKKDVIPLTEIAVKNARTSYSAKSANLRQLIDALRTRRTQELELLGAQMDVIVARTRMRELLSTPPMLRFAPMRPTTFGMDTMGESMGADVMGSSTTNMGPGMSGPTRRQSKDMSNSQGGSGSSGMGGM
jgi:outer membrane protein, heavy metal efflux system